MCGKKAISQNSIDGCVAAILKYLELDFESKIAMSKNSIQIVSNLFHPSIIVEKYKNVINKYL